MVDAAVRRLLSGVAILLVAACVGHFWLGKSFAAKVWDDACQAGALVFVLKFGESRSTATTSTEAILSTALGASFGALSAWLSACNAILLLVAVSMLLIHHPCPSKALAAEKLKALGAAAAADGGQYLPSVGFWQLLLSTFWFVHRAAAGCGLLGCLSAALCHVALLVAATELVAWLPGRGAGGGGGGGQVGGLQQGGGSGASSARGEEVGAAATGAGTVGSTAAAAAGGAEAAVVEGGSPSDWGSSPISPAAAGAAVGAAAAAGGFLRCSSSSAAMGQALLADSSHLLSASATGFRPHQPSSCAPPAALRRSSSAAATAAASMHGSSTTHDTPAAASLASSFAAAAAAAMGAGCGSQPPPQPPLPAAVAAAAGAAAVGRLSLDQRFGLHHQRLLNPHRLHRQQQQQQHHHPLSGAGAGAAVSAAGVRKSASPEPCVGVAVAAAVVAAVAAEVEGAQGAVGLGAESRISGVAPVLVHEVCDGERPGEADVGGRGGAEEEEEGLPHAEDSSEAAAVAGIYSVCSLPSHPQQTDQQQEQPVMMAMLQGSGWGPGQPHLMPLEHHHQPEPPLPTRPPPGPRPHHHHQPPGQEPLVRHHRVTGSTHDYILLASTLPGAAGYGSGYDEDDEYDSDVYDDEDDDEEEDGGVGCDDGYDSDGCFSLALAEGGVSSNNNNTSHAAAVVTGGTITTAAAPAAAAAATAAPAWGGADAGVSKEDGCRNSGAGAAGVRAEALEVSTAVAVAMQELAAESLSSSYPYGSAGTTGAAAGLAAAVAAAAAAGGAGGGRGERGASVQGGGMQGASGTTSVRGGVLMALPNCPSMRCAAAGGGGVADDGDQEEGAVAIGAAALQHALRACDNGDEDDDEYTDEEEEEEEEEACLVVHGDEAEEEDLMSLGEVEAAATAAAGAAVDPVGTTTAAASVAECTTPTRARRTATAAFAASTAPAATVGLQVMGAAAAGGGGGMQQQRQQLLLDGFVAPEDSCMACWPHSPGPAAGLTRHPSQQLPAPLLQQQQHLHDPRGAWEQAHRGWEGGCSGGGDGGGVVVPLQEDTLARHTAASYLLQEQQQLLALLQTGHAAAAAAEASGAPEPAYAPAARASAAAAAAYAPAARDLWGPAGGGAGGMHAAAGAGTASLPAELLLLRGAAAAAAPASPSPALDLLDCFLRDSVMLASGGYGRIEEYDMTYEYGADAAAAAASVVGAVEGESSMGCCAVRAECRLADQQYYPQQYRSSKQQKQQRQQRQRRLSAGQLLARAVYGGAQPHTAPLPDPNLSYPHEHHPPPPPQQQQQLKHEPYQPPHCYGEYHEQLQQLQQQLQEQQRSSRQLAGGLEGADRLRDPSAGAHALGGRGETTRLETATESGGATHEAAAATAFVHDGSQWQCMTGDGRADDPWVMKASIAGRHVSARVCPQPLKNRYAAVEDRLRHAATDDDGAEGDAMDGPYVTSANAVAERDMTAGRAAALGPHPGPMLVVGRGVVGEAGAARGLAASSSSRGAGYEAAAQDCCRWEDEETFGLEDDFSCGGKDSPSQLRPSPTSRLQSPRGVQGGLHEQHPLHQLQFYRLEQQRQQQQQQRQQPAAAPGLRRLTDGGVTGAAAQSPPAASSPLQIAADRPAAGGGGGGGGGGRGSAGGSLPDRAATAAGASASLAAAATSCGSGTLVQPFVAVGTLYRSLSLQHRPTYGSQRRSFDTRISRMGSIARVQHPPGAAAVAAAGVEVEMATGLPLTPRTMPSASPQTSPPQLLPASEGCGATGGGALSSATPSCLTSPRPELPQPPHLPAQSLSPFARHAAAAAAAVAAATAAEDAASPHHLADKLRQSSSAPKAGTQLPPLATTAAMGALGLTSACAAAAAATAAAPSDPPLELLPAASGSTSLATRLTLPSDGCGMRLCSGGGGITSPPTHGSWGRASSSDEEGGELPTAGSAVAEAKRQPSLRG
ncbi:hypothetical protein Agub_g2645 [Astrephomene gubernaculifera]|uniref:Uncharacterized protein n=1 Tax=Astrephomene gubernaculifera TaxID=47775 RepID=A0AAD3DHD6_9CHLO|nr:hypothetical protein Agub_g2645 [Astrephomene gubernaculifera]